MKKTMIALVAMMLALTLAGCSDNDVTSGYVETKVNDAQEELTNQGNELADWISDHFEECCAKYPPKDGNYDDSYLAEIEVLCMNDFACSIKLSNFSSIDEYMTACESAVTAMKSYVPMYDIYSDTIYNSYEPDYLTYWCDKNIMYLANEIYSNPAYFDADGQILHFDPKWIDNPYYMDRIENYDYLLSMYNKYVLGIEEDTPTPTSNSQYTEYGAPIFGYTSVESMDPSADLNAIIMYLEVYGGLGEDEILGNLDPDYETCCDNLDIAKETLIDIYGLTYDDLNEAYAYYKTTNQEGRCCYEFMPSNYKDLKNTIYYICYYAGESTEEEIYQLLDDNGMCYFEDSTYEAIQLANDFLIDYYGLADWDPYVDYMENYPQYQ